MAPCAARDCRDHRHPPNDDASTEFARQLGAARRVGLFGGTFDPVHIGHLIAATEVLAQLHLDRLLFLPAGQPPHKGGRTIATAPQRLRMLELATAGRAGFAVSTFDLHTNGPSYTADLLERAHAASKSPREFYFLMGEDSLRDFANWREPGTIARLARLAVVTRPEASVNVQEVIALVPGLAHRVHCLPIPHVATSSSDLRERVATGRPIAYQVPVDVERYIDGNGLYR